MLCKNITSGCWGVFSIPNPRRLLDTQQHNSFLPLFRHIAGNNSWFSDFRQHCFQLPAVQPPQNALKEWMAAEPLQQLTSFLPITL